MYVVYMFNLASSKSPRTFLMMRLSFDSNTFCPRIEESIYTPNGYIVPVEFGVHFLPCVKNVPKRTELQLNEIGLTNNEFCKRQIRLRQPPIFWKNCRFFCNTGVRVNVTAKL